MTHTPDKQTAILDTTLKLIAERGFHGTSMSQIAKASGVSAGIIYHYFENKDDLIRTLYRTTKIHLMDTIASGYDSALPIRERFVGIWRRLLLYYINHPEVMAFLEQYENSPYASEPVEYVQANITALTDEIAHSMAAGELKTLPLEVFYALTFEIAATVAKLHHAGNLALNDELIDNVALACWDAVKG